MLTQTLRHINVPITTTKREHRERQNNADIANNQRFNKNHLRQMAQAILAKLLIVNYIDIGSSDDHRPLAVIISVTASLNSVAAMSCSMLRCIR